ncbi:hypothetical protein RJI84_00815 [Buchnera aphidicola (Chaitoregma tattakana)]|uniref:hypothetical protein n=1 Tax=Buchnera aphidicola TaxID=9 RepID=UPI0031B83DCC
MKKKFLLNYKDLLSFMPYKYPLLLVDKIISIKKNIFIKSFKIVKKDDFFLSKHFFLNSVYPGVLILEFLHQTSFVLLYKNKILKNKNKNFYLAKIIYAKFFYVIKSDDVMIGNVSIIKKSLNTYVFYGKVLVNGRIICSASFICAIK